MKKRLQSILGVTLLEIMLVLAIAAMIIVMSVRYYQSANASQQATQALQLIQAITAAADSVSQGTGSYSKNVSTSRINDMLSNVGGLTLPWGGTATISPSTTSYTVTLDSTPAAVCGILLGNLSGNQYISNISTCGSTASDFSYTYNMQPQSST